MRLTQACWIACLAGLAISAPGLCAEDTRLVDAAKRQDKEAVQLLLKQRIDVNAPYGDGTTALHWAAHRNDLDLADVLIRAGANVNAVTDLGITPLYLAANNGNVLMVEKLLAAHANPNLRASTGVSPLMLGARAGTLKAVQALIASGAEVNAQENSQNQTALMWAVAESHPDVVQALVDHRADVHARTRSTRMLVVRGDMAQVPNDSSIDTTETGGTTPLLFAARQGDIESAKVLIEAGAKVNETAADGSTALVIAMHSGHGEFASFLLDRGADPNADGAGYSALHAAVLRDDVSVVKALLAHKADPNKPFVKATPIRRNGPDVFLPASLVGATPFLLAAKYASAEMMRAMMSSGADVHVSTKDGTTPLIAAAGADREGRGGKSAGAVPEAQSREVVQLLIQLGADVNAVNAAGDTAVHLAAAKSSNNVIQLLADAGAKLDAKNKRGLTPLAVASGRVRRFPAAQSTVDLLQKLTSAAAR